MTPLGPIDQLIDNAAARLTHARPSHAFRANVMARIAVAQPSRFQWRYVFAGSAAAIVLAGVLTLREGGPVSPKPEALSAVNNAPTVEADPTATKNDSSPLTSMPRTVAAHDSGQLAFASLAGAEQEWTGQVIPALEHPELMTVKPLFEGAPIKGIDIEPIRMAPLVVPTLDDINR